MVKIEPLDDDSIAILKTISLLSVVLMAGTDGLSAVFARSMKDVHFSIIMFWFSFIGCVLFYTIIIC